MRMYARGVTVAITLASRIYLDRERSAANLRHDIIVGTLVIAPGQAILSLVPSFQTFLEG
jgi:hypothetical protein